jgi:hypothetical protein
VAIREGFRVAIRAGILGSARAWPRAAIRAGIPGPVRGVASRLAAALVPGPVTGQSLAAAGRGIQATAQPPVAILVHGVA